MDPAARRRSTPLVAPGRGPEPVEQPALGRGLAVSVGIGVGTAAAVAGLAYALVAGPIYMLAQISPDGLDRPAFRNGLLVGLAVCALIGVAVGVATGLWASRGGRLPTDRRPFLDR